MSAEHASLPYLRETLLFLALSGLLIPLLQRLRINQVLGFIAAGALLGPFGLSLWTDRWPWLQWFTFPSIEGVSILAELGVIFLMFVIGLELSGPRLWAIRRWVFGAGTAQVLLSGLVLGAVAMAVGLAWPTALVLGLVLALSSTAVVMQLLTQRHALASPTGQATFGVLMFQDLAVVPLLILIDVLASKDAGLQAGWTLAGSMAKSGAAVALILIVGRRIIQPLFRRFASQHQPEVFMALTLLTTLSIGGATAAAGLSMALGAMLAGLILAETEFRHEVEVTVEPFKGLLMGLFFISVGMGVDLREVAKSPWLLLAGVAGLFVLKGLVAAAVLRMTGLDRGKAIEAGLLLAQGGEFAFIAIGHASTSGLVPAHLAQYAMVLVSASLFATPALARLGAALAERLDHERAEANRHEVADDHLHDHVIIAGCGRVGRLLADVLASKGIPFVAIEHDAHVVARLRAQGLPAVYGNAARPELLRKLQAQRARAVVMTMDKPTAAMHTVRAIRAEYPLLPVFARSRDEQHAHSLLQAGATQVVPETLEAALQLSGSVLLHLGLSEAEASGVLHAERTRRLPLQTWLQPLDTSPATAAAVAAARKP